VAVLREWESLDAGDVPELVFLHEQTAAICAAVLPVIEREPLYHQGEDRYPDGPLPGSFPAAAVFGEQGPQIVTWARRYDPRLFFMLHVVEGIVRSPKILAELNRAAGPGALAQVGRYLAARQGD
jgi:hypothetical protein